MIDRVERRSGDVFHIRPIAFEISRSAREAMAHDKGLVEDDWDAASEHFGLYAGLQLIGTYRVVAPRDGRLPLNEHAPCVPVETSDRQVGRFVTSRPLLTLTNRAAFFAAYVDQLRQAPGRTYVATAENGPISARRWEQLGFVRTGESYSDPRYRAPLLIMVRSPG